MAEKINNWRAEAINKLSAEAPSKHKKKKAQVSKSSRKSDHKHKFDIKVYSIKCYEEEDYEYNRWEGLKLLSFCSICGKMSGDSILYDWPHLHNSERVTLKDLLSRPVYLSGGWVDSISEIRECRELNDDEKREVYEQYRRKLQKCNN